MLNEYNLKITLTGNKKDVDKVYDKIKQHPTICNLQIEWYKTINKTEQVLLQGISIGGINIDNYYLIQSCFVDTNVKTNIITYSTENLDYYNIDINKKGCSNYKCINYKPIIEYDYKIDDWDKFVIKCLECGVSDNEVDICKNYKQTFYDLFDDNGDLEKSSLIFLKLLLLEDFYED